MKRSNKKLSLVLIILILFSFLPSTLFAAALKITSIKDLSVSVYVNQSYILPTVIDATMSNKTTQRVNVAWNPKAAVTTKAGTFVYKGTIKGYSKQVLLTLKVIPVNKEVQRAISYGFVPKELQSDWDKTITHAEFCEMLTKLVTLYDASKVPVWKKKSELARGSNQPMQRDDGALALYYAAELMGLANYSGNFDLEGFVGMEGWWGGVKWNYPLFPGWDKPWIDAASGKASDSNIMQAADWFVIRRVSAVDGSTLFDFDDAGLIHFGNDFTREAAIKAVLRLYESDWEVAAKVDYTKWCSEKCLTYFNQIDARRKEILNSPTKVTYTGTAYYISNRGSDANDGKTPATAWATVDKVNSANLSSGDAVFFERGGLWRGIYLLCREGVTYSAYGEGDKPVFTLSPEDGADTSKWMLYYEGADGEKIWKFYRNMYDCSNLFFNGGKSWAYKVAPHWRHGRWMNSDGTAFDVKKQLYRNHAFFSSVDSALPKTDKVEYIWYPDYITDGPLYLRCDEGNPGQVFYSIEFGCMGKGYSCGFMEMQSGCTADNLCIRYVGMQGIFPGKTDCTIQNCEIGWCGGAMLSDNGHELFAPGKDMVNVAGGGINIGGQNNVVVNNYIHDAFAEGITLEGDSNGPQFNNIVRRNLIERAYAGILIVHWNMDENAKPFWNDLDVSDNIVSMSGFTWGNSQGTQCYPMGSALNLPECPNTNRNLRVHDNLFLGCYGWMFTCCMPDKNLPMVYNNTFCTLSMSTLPFINRDYVQYPAGQAEKFINKKFGNDTNKVIVVD